MSPARPAPRHPPRAAAHRYGPPRSGAPPPRRLTGMRPLLWGLLLLLAPLAGCAPRGPAYETFTHPQLGFSVAYPRGWAVVERPEEGRVWFVPPGLVDAGAVPHLETASFLAVFTLDVPGPVSDDEARRLGLSLLPIHGVSGFRRFRNDDGVTWHRFEVTGASRGGEWASVGLLVSGRERLRYVVCARPLGEWRQAQKSCDEILRTFRPGAL